MHHHVCVSFLIVTIREQTSSCFLVVPLLVWAEEMEEEPGARTSSETVVAVLLHHTVRMKVESCGRSGMYEYICSMEERLCSTKWVLCHSKENLSHFLAISGILKIPKGDKWAHLKLLSAISALRHPFSLYRQVSLLPNHQYWKVCRPWYGLWGV